jgi:hypothetical protein
VADERVQGDDVELGIAIGRVVGIADLVGDVVGQPLIGGEPSGGIDQGRAVVDAGAAAEGQDPPGVGQRQAQASVLLAEGAPAMAAASLQRGIALWREAGASYETARARLLLGEALERHGDRKHALVEFDAARESFDALGAELDLQRAARLLASALRVDVEVAGSGSTSPATVTGSPGRPGRFPGRQVD